MNTTRFHSLPNIVNRFIADTRGHSLGDHSLNLLKRPVTLLITANKVTHIVRSIGVST